MKTIDNYAFKRICRKDLTIPRSLPAEASPQTRKEGLSVISTNEFLPARIAHEAFEPAILRKEKR